MEAVFLKILNMSITAGWLTVAVMALRLILKKAPKWIMGILWGFVALRLICPISLESGLSLIPSQEPIPGEILTQTSPEIQSGIPILDQMVNPVIGETLAPDAGESVKPLQVITHAASLVWMAGMAGMLLYALASYLAVRRRVAEAVLERENILLCDRVSTPFILGVFRPKIYLPSSMEEGDRQLVLAHERAHLKRRDHLWKPLGFLLLCVYWFNPLLWVAYILLCRDIELACDEKVIRELGSDVKKPYSEALIQCSIPRRVLAACPLAFGEVGVKERVKRVLSYKKPAFWMILLAVIAITVTAVCLLTDPRTTFDSMDDLSDSLQVFLDTQTAEEFSSGKEGENRLGTAAYHLMRAEQKGSKTTLYLWVLYKEFSMNGGILETWNAFSGPAVVTVHSVDGSYTLLEYWLPRDGNLYRDDIRAKFPVYLWPQVMNGHHYAQALDAQCEQQAGEYFGAFRPDAEPDSSATGDWGVELFVFPEEGTDYQLKIVLSHSSRRATVEGKLTTTEEYGIQPVWVSEMPVMPADGIKWDSQVYEIQKDSYISIHKSLESTYGRLPHGIYLLSKPITLTTPDGKQYTKTLSAYFAAPQKDGDSYDVAVFDVDKDGKQEVCMLTPGGTYGLATFGLSVFENGHLDYFGIFADFSPSGFTTHADEWKLFGPDITPNGEEAEILVDISVVDGNLTLTTQEGNQIYSSEQGVEAFQWYCFHHGFPEKSMTQEKLQQVEQEKEKLRERIEELEKMAQEQSGK